MDIWRPATTTEVRALIGVVQCYRDMCPRGSHILAPLTEAASGPKGRKILWNVALESSFKELKHMVSDEMMLSHLDWKLPFTVHANSSDKQLVAVIIQNNKPNDFFSRILSKPQHNYTTIDNKILAILECLKKSWGIVFDYEINVFSYNKNLFYPATLRKSQRVMLW